MSKAQLLDKRVRDNTKSGGKYFQNNIPIMDGQATIYTMPVSGDVWQFRMWVKEENRQVRKSLRTRDLTEAIDRGRKEYSEIMQELGTGKKLFGTPFKDSAAEWLAYQKKRSEQGLITEGRYKTLKTQINRHIVPYVLSELGKRTKIGGIGPLDFMEYAEFRRDKAKGVQQVTIRNEHTTIGSLMKWCFRQRYTNFESCDFEEIKIKEVIRRDTFTMEEYETLFKFLRKWKSDKDIPYRTAKSNMMPLKKKNFMADSLLLNANNLMRVGELRQLKWGMTKTFKRGKYFYTQYDLPSHICKNRKSRSFVTRGGEYLNRIKTYSNFLEKDDFVICDNESGDQISKTEYYRMWRDIIENLDINMMGADGKGRNITPYSLRHFGITCRLAAGVGHYEVSKIAGTSVGYIETHYEHLDMTKLMDTATADFKTDKDGIIHRFNRED